MCANPSQSDLFIGPYDWTRNIQTLSAKGNLIAKKLQIIKSISHIWRNTKDLVQNQHILNKIHKK